MFPLIIFYLESNNLTKVPLNILTNFEIVFTLVDLLKHDSPLYLKVIDAKYPLKVCKIIMLLGIFLKINSSKHLILIGNYLEILNI